MIEHEKTSIKLSYETPLDLRQYSGRHRSQGPLLTWSQQMFRTFDALR
jgi:hypothetical protein